MNTKKTFTCRVAWGTGKKASRHATSDAAADAAVDAATAAAV